jgi:hypothetical protein
MDIKLNKRDQYRLKIYTDYMQSLGMFNINSEDSQNGWYYSYAKNYKFWLVNLTNGTTIKFQPRIYRFKWQKNKKEPVILDLHDENGDLLKYNTKSFTEFKKYLKQSLAQLNEYSLIKKKIEMKNRMKNLEEDF